MMVACFVVKYCVIEAKIMLGKYLAFYMFCILNYYWSLSL